MSHLRQVQSVLGVFVLGLLSCAAVSATPITFNFTGALNFVDPALSPTFSVGQAWSMAVTFDSTSAPFFDNGVVAEYAGNSASAIVTAGAYGATIDPAAAGKPNPISVQNDFITFGDELSIFALALVGNPVGGKTPGWASISLSDPTGTAFPDTSLPTSLDLTKFQGKGFGITFGDTCSYDPGVDIPTASCSGSVFIGGTIDSVTVSAGGTVPEPGTPALLLAAALAVVTAVRRATTRRPA